MRVRCVFLSPFVPFFAILNPQVVRKQTLMILTSLMQEEYIKWNTYGSSLLFFRCVVRMLSCDGSYLTLSFIISLVDSSPAIRHSAEACLISLLNKKSNGGVNLFYNNFIEAIFYLNDYRYRSYYLVVAWLIFRDHSTYNCYKQTDKERALFSLKGGINREKRQTVRIELASLAVVLTRRSINFSCVT